MKRYLVYCSLGGIIMMFLFFALSALGATSLWLDEGITFYNSSGSFADITGKTANLDLSPPLYYYLIKVWRSMSGLDATHSAILLRLPSVFFAVLSLLMVYLIARKSFNEKVGLIAAFLLAINPFFVGFAREARMYMLLTALILCAYFLLLKIFKQEELKKSWLLLTIVNILGIYTHNFYWFALASLGLTAILFIPFIKHKTKLLAYAAGSGIITLLAFAPWLSSFLKQLEVNRYWIAAINREEVKNFLLDFGGGNKLAFHILGALILIGLAYFALVVKKKKEPKNLNFNFYFLLIFCGLSFLLPLAYSLWVSPLLKVRYLLYLPAFLSILAAIGAYSFKRIQALFVAFPLVVLLLIWHPWNNFTYPMEMNENFAYAEEYIQAKSPQTPVIIHSPSAAHVYGFYNNGYGNLQPFPSSYDLRDYNIDENSKEKFLNLASKYKDFWLLVTHSHENPQGILRQWSESICPQVEEKSLGPIFIAHYQCADSTYSKL